jgi:NADH:quinone reductase (non-electrogenic)
VIARTQGKSLPPFRYKDIGEMATIGRSAAVAVIGKRHFWGFIAWFLWLAIHIVWLIGFRNRLVVLVDWAWAYVTFHGNARVIFIPPETHTPSPTKTADTPKPEAALRG